MADIFISYANKEAQLTKDLARDLEAEGYTTWWDTSLLPGDEFPEEINRQIDDAQAVIVIWTKNSAQSKWVRAEANRAHALGKLVTVHAKGFDVRSLPLPFNTLQSSLVTDRAKIFAVLARRGIKPTGESIPHEDHRPKVRFGVLKYIAVAFLLVTGLTLFLNYEPKPELKPEPVERATERAELVPTTEQQILLNVVKASRFEHMNISDKFRLNGPLTPLAVADIIRLTGSREIVFSSLLGEIAINIIEGQSTVHFQRLSFHNDPTNDTWTDDSKAIPEYDPVVCEAKALIDRVEGVQNSPYSPKIWGPFQSDYWLGKHSSDCSFHKFLMLNEQLLRFGITAKVVGSFSSSFPTIVLPKRSDDGKKRSDTNAAPPTVVILDRSEQPKTLGAPNVILCFDPTIAAYSGINIINKATACPDFRYRETPLEQKPIPSHFGRYDESMEPQLRSPYAVFQFYGALLRTRTEVKLSDAAKMRTGSSPLFDIRSTNKDCSTYVRYSDLDYCVPKEGAGNTKIVLEMLNVISQIDEAPK